MKYRIYNTSIVNCVYNHSILIIKGKVVIYITFVEKIIFSTQNTLKNRIKITFYIMRKIFSRQKFPPISEAGHVLKMSLIF